MSEATWSGGGRIESEDGETVVGRSGPPEGAEGRRATGRARMVVMLVVGGPISPTTTTTTMINKTCLPPSLCLSVERRGVGLWQRESGPACPLATAAALVVDVFTSAPSCAPPPPMPPPRSPTDKLIWATGAAAAAPSSHGARTHGCRNFIESHQRQMAEAEKREGERGNHRTFRNPLWASPLVLPIPPPPAPVQSSQQCGECGK